MSASGALVGFVFGLALLLVLARLPIFRRMALADRVDPYLTDTVPVPRAAGPFGRRSAIIAVASPILAAAATRLDRFLGGRASVELRLGQAGRPIDVAAFRTSQVVWASCGFGLGLGVLLLRLALGVGPAPAGCLAAMLGLACFGAMARDTLLTREVAKREQRILAELPVIAELLSLAVTAGEGPVGALERVTRRSTGPLADELREALGNARTGTTVVEALQQVATRMRIGALTRFVDGMAVSIERGTPLADVLRAQAADAREGGKRALLEQAAKKEVAMLAPIVFLVLPVVVMFALYPGFIQFTAVTS